MTMSILRRLISAAKYTNGKLVPTPIWMQRSYSQQVKIVEVGPRDGLQNESSRISVDDKVKLITKLAEAGCTAIETGSFVSPKYVPSMANTSDVMNRLKDWKQESSDSIDKSKISFSCLVPNLKGLDQAVKAGEVVDEIAIFASASEGFSQRNINCSIDESLERFRAVTDVVKENHPRLRIRGYLSCVIACPYEGKIAPTTVARLAEKMFNELGCYELSLGDTIGVGTPTQTLEMLEAVQMAVGADRTCDLAVHFHDTYGQALANILISLDRAGISTIDSSVAGLGGCPYAAGASGNVATEDVVYMLNGMGVETGIDLVKLAEAGSFISKVLGQPTRSKVGKALASKMSL